MSFGTSDYEAWFQRLTGWAPFPFQVELAELLFEGRNVVLRAPTGAGKTWSVLLPFLADQWLHRPSKLIYVLPLRTLAEAIYEEARRLVALAGSTVPVTIQTGERPDDPFFDLGQVIVTTYDQLLSGLLETPYGLPDRLHNVNSASIAGALVVFDEFHLMEPQRAFSTSTAMLTMFEGLCQSVWMTATATVPLVEQLRSSIGAASVPDDEQGWAEMLASLPSVNSVERKLVLSPEALSASAVLDAHLSTSLVIVNTVDRAQELYGELQAERACRGTDAEVILLHARFFKAHRQQKAARLQELFGKSPRRSAILIATQVVEAGLDISCEHLHTEICPMNALVQRAGRCARFPGQRGLVHVYPLPSAPRSWLPYGTLQAPHESLIKTQELLESNRDAQLDPTLASRWVQAVHGEADANALRDGIESRLTECSDIIYARAFQRQAQGVSELIREPDTDQVRALICSEGDLPDVPSRREFLSLSRWRLMRLMRERPDIGWRWDWTNQDQPWHPLRTPEDLRITDIACLTPAAAAYDADSGLRLGRPGVGTSPVRDLPARPGYAPLKREAWAVHARNVSQEALRRVAKERELESLLCHGLLNRYGLSPDELTECVSASGLLHDLGKLQERWQEWAAEAQRGQSAGYMHDVPLAHTDFNRADPEDVRREREVSRRFPRPPHAAASAFCGTPLIGRMLSAIADERRTLAASAVLAAVNSHHGGWWPDVFEPPKMWSGWEIVAEQALCIPCTDAAARMNAETTGRLLRIATGPDTLRDSWPLVAFLMRTLRLSDQRATAEAGGDE